jgi:2-polyprenyl-3-methyl-5-hydroxy-6-metoxy-1,4-benzoquinol methylase
MSTGPTPEEIVALQETLYTSRNPTRRWLHLTRKAWIEAAIADAGPGRDALEVGPGSGVYLPTLQKHFDTVTASDVEEAHLKQLEPNFPKVTVVRDDITSTTLPAAGFDLILCSEVVEHIPDSAAAFRGMFELLRPGGFLLLSTPQRFSPLELASKVAFLPGVVQVVRWIYGEPILKQGHINLMTERTVREQLEAAGFRHQTDNYTGVYLPLIAEFTGGAGLSLARRLEEWLRGTPLQWLLWTQYHVVRKPEGTE